MHRLTGSSLAVGFLGLAELLPLLITAFVGGALADALDRRRMVIFREVGLTAGCGLLMLNAGLERPSVSVLYVAAALMSALQGLQRPSLEALTPRLVDKDEIPAAAALSSLLGSVGMIAGPALGGVLIGSLRPVAAYAVDAFTYMASLLCFLAMRTVTPPENQSGRAWRRWPRVSAMREAVRS